ncbi:MAG TPA: ABC transporter permease [Caldithrix abyssi]|uniref:Cell division protein FtsX n=1 Tax=Caldithrix abyssi TaxID=187145 RepID=A0A7V5LKK5_CALAY|nr:ABC transporter permease [Caldisericaceae bacterium]HHE56080.1 ABC transporter permease [Caldithrix abyssi]
MSFFFTVKEGIKGLSRARLATFLTITTVTLSLFLIGFFIALFINIDQWLGEKRKNIEVEVFLEPVLEQTKIDQIYSRLKGIEGIERIEFISKELAAERFKKEFGQDVQAVLGTNPLPPSFIIHLKTGFRNASAIRAISKKIEKIDGVTEVVYASGALDLLDRYITIIYLILGGLGLVLIVITVILIHNSIRLIIYARREIIEIMKLVGATRAFIRRPFLVEGFFYGLSGGLLADLFLFAVIYLTKSYLYDRLIMPYPVYGLLLGLGLLVGFVSSQISINKHLNTLL